MLHLTTWMLLFIGRCNAFFYNFTENKLRHNGATTYNNDDTHVSYIQYF